ncbi:hypothetical protein OPV22_017580 [Ensete ventricosum]|uniref:EF-hand domain-containing protein n=1 Tax=Ensete ventricosum TaxID=4639 RepID=A0AAV8PFD4_ENSVE|nr:hypothetical protein OPV22_017580 [Ensete ventricosum]
MSVVILDGSTIREFVNDEGAFSGSVEERVASLDTDHNGLRWSGGLGGIPGGDEGGDVGGGERARIPPDSDGGGGRQLYLGLFGRFDCDGSGAVDLEEFLVEMREVMLVVANGLGFRPIQMVVKAASSRGLWRGSRRRNHAV